ncbi:dinitrogenase iron-molybdenum cofactor biosynthesis protein [Candidatus Bathyarchaeota archaeon]|nr:MAG: dinitrogenase iron-molybdenum cofactor biosynthesis protein [Candidatus Bathyarchaeota archaeon]
MRVAIPSYSPGGLDAQVFPHFGRCEVFTIVDIEDGEIRGVDVVPNRSFHFGGALSPAEMLVNLGVKCILSMGLGRRALAILQEYGIKAYITTASSVREAIREFVSGTLKPMSMDEACPGRHHVGHEHEHHW